MKNLSRIDLGNNDLTTIREHDFASNVNIEMLSLERNEINKIHPKSFSNLRNKLNIEINLRVKQCVEEQFYLRGESDWIRMMETLQPCFDHYLKAHSN